MTSASVVKTLKKALPRARVYGLASTGEVVIERGGRKRGRANITVLSQAEALAEARRLVGGEDLAVSANKAKVVHSLIQFFEMQQVVWLYLEEQRPKEATNPLEDVTNSNGDPEEYYPFVGTEDVPATHKEEVVNVKDITELKLEAVRARVIEFKASGRTFVRVVRNADKAAFAQLKADIRARLELDTPMAEVEATQREIYCTLRARPGYVYANI